MATIEIKFGNLDLTEAVESWEQVLDTRLSLMQVPKRHGALIAEVPVAEPRTIRIKGRTQDSDLDSLRTVIDGMEQWLNNRRQRLTLYSDRYVNAYKRSFGYGFVPGTALTAIDFVIDFICDDPFFYDTSDQSSLHTVTTSDDASPDGGYTKNVTINNPGTAFQFVLLTVTADQGNAIPNFTVSNTTNARTFVWNSAIDSVNGAGPVAAGNAIVADMGNFTLLNNGVEDLINLQSGSTFLWLDPGDNIISLRSDPASYQFDFTARYY